MKRKLLLIILLLIPFGVFAKASITYGWEKENDPIEFLTEEDNQYLVYENRKISYYNPSGKRIKSVTEDAFGSDKLFEIRENKHGNKEVITETDTQIIIAYPGDNYIDFCPIPTLENPKPVCENTEISSLSESDQKKYTGDYYFFVEYYEEYEDKFGYYMENGIYIIVKNVMKESPTQVEVYNSDGEVVDKVTTNKNGIATTGKDHGGQGYRSRNYDEIYGKYNVDI